jgi:DNA-binding LacI/PurR family transcriptional regulator
VIGLEQTTGARQATEHLLALGHDTVWHVAGPTGQPSARARERASARAYRSAESQWHGRDVQRPATFHASSRERKSAAWSVV